MAHGDDIMYLSKLVMKGQAMAQSEEDKRMVDIYRKLITNFIRCGSVETPEYEYPGMVIPLRLSTPTSQNGTQLKSQGSRLDISNGTSPYFLF